MKTKLSLLCIIFCSVVALEIGLQAVYRIVHHQFLFLSPFSLSRDFISEASGPVKFHLTPTPHDSFLHINASKYRGEEEENPQILMLGDSVPFGTGVSWEKTYPYLSQKLSHKRVINAGVPSYNLIQSLNHWREDFSKVQPETVILHAANDLSLLFTYGKKWDLQQSWLKERILKKKTSLWKKAAAKIVIVHLVDWMIEEVQKPVQGPKQLQEVQETLPYFLTQIGTVLNEAHAYSKEKGSALILIPINPFCYLTDDFKNKTLRLFPITKNPDAFEMQKKVILAFNTTLKNFAESHSNTYYFDIVKEMDTLDRNALFLDEIHMNEKGNSIFAERLIGFLHSHQL